ncbi:MAG: GntR family transcriptional regulator [Lachnospiraceae bacterium]|nr:GntR family transcriptional regulator [Lachnospiraceae bacterium]
MDFIDYQDSRPIYEQIADRYKFLILKGVMAPDEQMPSVRKLAMELSTNPNTVQKAYMELEREGYIYAVKGRGNFVRADEGLWKMKKKELAEELREIFQKAKELGIDVDELVKEAKEDDRN